MIHESQNNKSIQIKFTLYAPDRSIAIVLKIRRRRSDSIVATGLKFDHLKWQLIMVPGSNDCGFQRDGVPKVINSVVAHTKVCVCFIYFDLEKVISDSLV